MNGLYEMLSDSNCPQMTLNVHLGNKNPDRFKSGLRI
jgi:hypothetical protein